MFKNRLRKNRRRWEKWAKRQRVDCYRIYDADIPEYNVAIDRYGDEFVLHEYRAPKKIPAGHAERRLRDAISLTLEEFGVARSALHLRVRKRQQGGKQYERREEEGERREVQENGHRFLVNLDEYLDAGIFLDQRPLRRLIQKEAQGKSFLNLFAYTGSATVYAAKGGATETLTVDLSNTYNSWARSNFDLNRMARHQHRIQRADCLEWLKGNHGKFDRILLAPPSYSRSRAMRGDFDLVRDYLPLIQETVRHLATGGVLYFVHHARGFKLDASALPDLDCVDTSKDTVAPDFVRSPHQSWRISKKRKAH
jgi:23S rRNA (guanine2445-N2)-methyltransferase / 23S rRNA (guanine2069-N7)-methyltransferase